jgi:hypothetical protein
MSDDGLFVIAPGTGTIIAASECRIVSLTPEQADAYADGDTLPEERSLTERTGLKVHDPWSAVRLHGGAIAEHFKEHEELAGLVEGFTDRDYADTGEWAYADDSLWDAVHAAIADAARKVRRKKERGDAE